MGGDRNEPDLTPERKTPRERNSQGAGSPGGRTYGRPLDASDQAGNVEAQISTRVTWGARTCLPAPEALSVGGAEELLGDVTPLAVDPIHSDPFSVFYFYLLRPLFSAL